jgi:hypothetical protein
MQTNDVVMIDLTQDSPKTLTKTNLLPKRTVPLTTNGPPPDCERPGKLPNPALLSSTPDPPLATFDPPLARKSNRFPRRSPTSEFRSDGESKRQDTGM